MVLPEPSALEIPPPYATTSVPATDEHDMLLREQRPLPLEDDGQTALVLGCVAFSFYTSLYFIKTSLFAARWDGQLWRGIELKTALALSQSLGYLVGKLPAAILVPTLDLPQLPRAALVVLWSSGALTVCAGLAPGTLGVPCSALAAVFLASGWSLVVRFTEGRARTDAIVSVVSISWISASGLVKSVGALLMQIGLSEGLMVVACTLGGTAAATAAAIAMGAQPRPSAADEVLRGKRQRIVSIRADGARLLSRHGVGIGLTTLAYALCGTLRVFRDLFLPELFAELGADGRPEAFVFSEAALALLVSAAVGCFSRVADNWRALNAILALAIAGMCLVSVATLAWRARVLGGLAWVSCVGAGVLIAYMPVGCLLYDRLLGASGEQLTTTLLVIVSDAAATAGASALLLYKQFLWPRVAARRGGLDGVGDVSAFFASTSSAVGGAAAMLMLGSLVAFNRSVRFARERSSAREAG
jgi:hypothetical protein